MKILLRGSVVLGLLAWFAGCGPMNSGELAAHVQADMQRELGKREPYAGIKIEDVALVHKGGTRYEGIGKGILCDLPLEFKVICEYDGTSAIWEAEPVGENWLTLCGRKGGKYCREKIGAGWRKVKDGTKKTYDAAVRKSGDLFDKTKGKVRGFLYGSETNVSDRVKAK